MTQPTPRPGMSRRDMLRNTAIGGAALWAAPVVTKFAPSALANYAAGIALVGTAGANADSLTLPAHQAGDLIVIAAGRSLGTSPTLPSGWTNIQQGGSGSAALRVGYRVATANLTASGTWSGAERIACWVFRGQSLATPIGASGQTNGTTSTTTLPALSLGKVDGSSWVLGAVYHHNINACPTFTDMTRRQLLTGNGRSNYLVADDTGVGVTSFPARSVTASHASDWRSIVVEIRAT